MRAEETAGGAHERGLRERGDRWSATGEEAGAREARAGDNQGRHNGGHARKVARKKENIHERDKGGTAGEAGGVRSENDGGELCITERTRTHNVSISTLLERTAEAAPLTGVTSSGGSNWKRSR